MSDRQYVQVAFPIPIRDVFTYVVPEYLQGRVLSGCQVTAFLGRRKLSGIVVGSEPREDLPRVRPLESLVRPEPVFDAQMLRLTREVAEHYMCPWGEVLAAGYPAHAQKTWRPSREQASVPRVPDRPGEGVRRDQPPHHLESELLKHFELLLGASRRGAGEVFLLHLPDELREDMYPLLAAEVLNHGGGVLFLVPEISTSGSLLEVLGRRFGSRMALFHSRLRISERKRIWERARAGELKVLVGTRSAVFLPVSNLKLIVVEDEHARPFKQEETPRYNGRDVAGMRGRLAGVPVLLASATPSVESVLSVKRGEFHLIGGAPFPMPMPSVSVVDMRKVDNRSQDSDQFSSSLISLIRGSIQTRSRALLFLNRRGFSTWVQCRDCGAVETCSTCELPLVFHSQEKSLLCHHCGSRTGAPSSCKKCHGTDFRFGGVGVQKVQASLEKLFPGARIERVDLDSARSRPEALRVAERFAGGDIDVLIGTIFVTKGLKLGRFAVAGMLHAESQLNLPDFRSGERAFQLLSEIASLAQAAGAELVVQTLNPEHHSVVSVCAGEPGLFYEVELKQRQELGYPPFSTLIAFHIAGPKEAEVIRVVETARSGAACVVAEGGGRIQVLGPSPAVPMRSRGRFRWYASLRGQERSEVMDAARKLLERLGGRHEVAGVTISVDVDPVGG
ncbi:MAG: primosomal protein N' [Candidatus Eiseniibacteriota bacterium]|nr:MAG: primosomal protein N' [Candidatus Eisenbacteria bacterium]